MKKTIFYTTVSVVRFKPTDVKDEHASSMLIDYTVLYPRRGDSSTLGLGWRYESKNKAFLVPKDFCHDFFSNKRVCLYFF
jgi:hypothetical protein